MTGRGPISTVQNPQASFIASVAERNNLALDVVYVIHFTREERFIPMPECMTKSSFVDNTWLLHFARLLNE